MYMIDMDCHPPFDAADIDYIGKVNYKDFFVNLERAGISKVCGTLLPPKGFFDSSDMSKVIKELNARTMELVRIEPRYIPVLWVHPDCAEENLSQLEQYVPLGARIVEVDGAWIDRVEMIPLFTHAQEHNVVLSLQNVTAEQVLVLAKRFPSLTMIVGGLTDRVFSPACVKDILSTCPQVYLKLSGSIWSCNYVLHEWCKQLDTERLLFGSGYPDCNPATKVAAAKWELRDQSDVVKQKIFCENAAKLFGEVRE